MAEKKRYTLLDILRAVAILNMIFYHAMWDVTHLFGVEASWFGSDGAHIWQRTIRWAFILLSGFCFSMSRNNFRRSLTVLAASAVISGVTLIFMPDSAIVFGVLSLIGAAMLITIPFDRLFRKIPPLVGFFACFALFLFTQHITGGYLGFFDLKLITLPDFLYANYFTSFFGLRHAAFFSTDYVPLFPWLFSFHMGYFAYRFFEKHSLLKALSAVKCKPLEWIGRHSLEIYLVHQPIVYGVLWLIFKIIR